MTTQIDLMQRDWYVTEPNFKLTDAEVYSTDTMRNTSIPGSNLSNVTLPLLEFRSENMEVINCHIHDLANVGWFSLGSGSIKGCLIQDIGWDAPDRTHGHFMYTQNRLPNTKVINGNIFVKGYGDGFRMYGSSKSFIEGFDVKNNIVLDSQWLIGGGKVRDVSLFHNFLLGSLQMGYTTEPQGNISVAGMTILGNVKFNCVWESVWFTHNIVKGNFQFDQFLKSDSVILDGNLYIGTVFKVGAKTMTFDQWKLYTGQDQMSRWYPTVEAAQGDLKLPLYQYMNVEQGKHRGNVVIWNPFEKFDIPEFWFTGDDIFEVRQVRDYALDRRLYRADDLEYQMWGAIQLPHGDWQPQYHPNALIPNLFPYLGVFEVWDAC